jgi:hypothetical protein
MYSVCIFKQDVQIKWKSSSMKNWSEIYPQLCIFFFTEIVKKNMQSD